MGETVSQFDLANLDAQRKIRTGEARKTKRPPNENCFEGSDGMRLFYRYWPAETGADDRAMTAASLKFRRPKLVKCRVQRIGRGTATIVG
jgi:hypothetical protein